MQSVVTRSPRGPVFQRIKRLAAKLSQAVQKHDDEPWTSKFAQPEGKTSRSENEPRLWHVRQIVVFRKNPLARFPTIFCRLQKNNLIFRGSSVALYCFSGYDYTIERVEIGVVTP